MGVKSQGKKGKVKMSAEGGRWWEDTEKYEVSVSTGGEKVSSRRRVAEKTQLE